MTRMKAVAAVAAIAVTPILGAVPPANAATHTISGTITCRDFWRSYTPPVAVWVDSQASGAEDGWAKISDVAGVGGRTTANYRYSTDDAGKFKLTVGCGGTQQNMSNSVTTDWLSPGTHNLTVRY